MHVLVTPKYVLKSESDQDLLFKTIQFWLEIKTKLETELFLILMPVGLNV